MLFLLFVVVAAAQVGIGDRLVRSAGIYANLPITISEARRQGWSFSDTCHPKLGFRATQQPEAISRRSPVSLYFSASGQLSGYAVDIFGPVARAALQEGWYERISTQRSEDGLVYRLKIGFRSRDVCSNTQFASPVGDVLFVVNNRGQLDFQIPLTANSATRKGFMKGACIGGMGTHYSFDLANRRGQMTWLANNLFPLMPMYDVDGSITAMLLPSISRQQTFDLYNVNQQDAVVIPNNLMCANWCDSACSLVPFRGRAWSDHRMAVWSTQHVYFRDHKTIKCPSRC